MKAFTYFSLFLFLFYSANSMASNNILKPFVTDGCTMFVDGTTKSPGLWKHCCIEHDMRYWFGGSIADMDKADLRLKQCVQEVAGINWATLIYSGVRAGHYSPVKNKTQWSWGWSQKRPQLPLTQEEAVYVIEELRRLPLDHLFIEIFIQRNFSINNDII